MKKKLLIFALAAALLFVCGCQSTPGVKFNAESRNITIITEPEGATVMQKHIADQPSSKLGISPVLDQPVVVITKFTKAIDVPFELGQQMMKVEGGNIMVCIEKEGYHTYNGILATKSGETLIHTIKLQKK